MTLISKFKYDSQSICVAEILNSHHNTPCAIQIASPIITSYLYSSRALTLSKANCNHKHWVRTVCGGLFSFVCLNSSWTNQLPQSIYTHCDSYACICWLINQYFFSCWGDISRCELISVRIVAVTFLCRSSTTRQLLYIIKRANKLLEINRKLAHRFVESIQVLMNEKSIFMSDFGKICASRGSDRGNPGLWENKKKAQHSLLPATTIPDHTNWPDGTTFGWKTILGSFGNRPVKTHHKRLETRAEKYAHLCWAKRTIWLLQRWIYRSIVWLSELSKNFPPTLIFQKI